MKVLLTLGHNSSAILIENSEVLCGYEEERLSKVKSDSSFPVLALNKILEFYPEAYLKVDEVLISHWFWSFDVPVESKYYQPKYIASNFPNAKVKSISYYETHHDLHAKSLWNFLDGDNSGLTIVADGFGNKGECLSIYKDGKLDHRCYDVTSSLGLMYQYAIRYLGMKENQDEYKLLGYEQQCDHSYKTNVSKSILPAIVNDVTNSLLDNTITMRDESQFAGDLNAAWFRWRTFFEEVSPTKSRNEIAYCVQAIVEGVMLNIIKKYNIKNIKLSGGVFYNVKLNNLILRYTDHLEVNPLAGDQGAALGFLDGIKINNLFWGLRSESDVMNDQSAYTIINDILTKGYSEIIRGHMEFGPRALCNTTCLAIPTQHVVSKINTINKRDTVMPMAPVVTRAYAEANFKDIKKVDKSKYYMIIAYDYCDNSVDIFNKGAAHIDSDRNVYTGRFQIADETDELLNEVLEYFDGILINTSLNAHGQPIIYDYNDYYRMKGIQND